MVEHRGHGGTSAGTGPFSIQDLAKDIIELLDYLDVRTTSLCGLSLGGIVSISIAANYPERIDKLVLACTSAYLGPAEPWMERANLVRRHGTMTLHEGLLQRWFTPGFVTGHPTISQDVADMLDSVNPESYAWYCEAIGQMDQRSIVGQINAPTLIIAGAQDPVTPPAMALDLNLAIANSSMVVLDDASHLANIESPHRFTQLVVDHLEELTCE